MSLFIVEIRDEEGNLVADAPRQQATRSELSNQYFEAHPDETPVATWEQVKEWHKTNGRHIRPRTW